MSEIEPTKFCRDCRFCKAGGGNLKWLFLLLPVVGWIILLLERKDDHFKYAKCTRPKMTADLLRPIVGRGTFCSIEREFGCKPEGMYWEPKNSVLKQLTNKQLMGEVLKRGMVKVMKDYKKES